MGSFSLIERVILSAGTMLIFFVYFHLTICPEGRNILHSVQYNPTFWAEIDRLPNLAEVIIWQNQTAYQLGLDLSYLQNMPRWV